MPAYHTARSDTIFSHIYLIVKYSRVWNKRSPLPQIRDSLKKDKKKGTKIQNLINIAPSVPIDLQTPLPLPEFFPIGQLGLPYSDH